MTTRRFCLYAAAVVVLALLVREYFVLVAQVNHPYGGDAREYIAYAENLLHGMFGKGATPDAYRTPGYPVFVMLSMLRGGDWYLRLIQWQAVLGTLTVVVVIGLAREWVSRGWALAAGLLMALQPHNIAATGEVLSEVLLGFVLVGALWLTVLAMRRRSLWLSIAAGAAFGVAYLVNPILAMFPPVVAVVFCRAGMARNGLILALVAVLALGAWSARSAHIGSSGMQRAYINLVQGSYPLYQLAYNSRKADPVPARIIKAIDAEVAVMVNDHAAGLRAMRERMDREPSVYARWYASKVYLLWDWDIRIGAGGPYVHDVYKSPLETHPLLLATTSILKAANPWLFLLSLGFALSAFWRRSDLALPALLFLYLTGVHLVLQAEPRYATAYRGIEMLMACGAMAYLAARVRRISAVPARQLTLNTLK